MPRDFLPFLYGKTGAISQGLTNASPGYFDVNSLHAGERSLNCVPVVTYKGVPGFCPRNQHLKIKTVASSSASRGRGLFTFGAENECLFDETDYRASGVIQDLKSTSSPGWAGNLGFYSDYLATVTSHSISGVSSRVFVNAGHTSTNASAEHGNVWYQTAPNVAPVSVQDADMPGNNGVSLVRGGVSLDGYFFVCDINGKIYNSALNDVTSWASTNFITAERTPDLGIYCGRHHDTLVYIGTESIEFFYNAGNATGSPLSRRQDISYRTGCYAPNSVLEMGDITYFVGTDAQGVSAVYALDKYNLTMISTPKINQILYNNVDTTPRETLLLSLGANEEIYLSSYDNGTSHGLILTISTEASYYFDFPTGEWCLWRFGASPTYTGALSAWTGCFPIIAAGKKFGQTGTPYYQMANGDLVQVFLGDNDAIDDMGEVNAPSVFCQTSEWDAGTMKKKRIHSVRVIYESNASSSTRNDPVTATLKWYDYKNKNTSTPPIPPTDYTVGRSVDLNTTRSPTMTRFGTTRRRQWLLDWLGHGNIAVAIGLEIEYEIVGE